MSIRRLFAPVALAVLPLGSVLHAQGSDSCASPQPIAGFASFIVDTTTATTGAQGQGNPLCDQFGTTGIERDVWFEWTAPFSGTARFETCGFANWDTKIAVYSGSGCPGCAPLACNDDACNLQSRVDFTCTQNEVYTLQVGSYPGASGGSGFMTDFVLGPAHLPRVHYTFDVPGGPGLDVSGYGHHAVFGAGTLTDGDCGLAYRFGADNDVTEMRAPDAPDLNMLGAVSGSAWVKPLGVHAGCPQGTIFSKAGNLWFQIEPGNDGLAFQNEGSGNDVVSVPIPPLPLGQWSHVAFVRAANTFDIRFYLNGEFVGAGSLHTLPGVNNWPLEIGNGHIVDSCELNGELDEIKIWNAALTDAEIRTEFAGSPHPVAPSSIVASSSTVCAGDTVTLNALGGCGDYIEWFAGSCGGTALVEGTGLTVSPTVTTTYYARWRSPSGCSHSECASFTVVVRAIPQAATAVVASPNPICAGSSTTLTAIGGVGTQFVWTDLSNGATYSGTSVVVSPATTRTYSGRWTSAPCPDSSARTVTVNVVQPPVAPSLISASSTSVCSGASVVLTAVGGTGDVFRWFQNGCGGTPLGAGTTLAVFPLATTTYCGRWESATCPPSACACTTITVSAPPTPPTSIGASATVVCAGSSVTLTASGGSGGSVVWSTGSCGGTGAGAGNSIVVAPITTTTYFARRLSSCGSSACASVTITVVAPAVQPVGAAASSTVVCPGETVILDVLGGSGQSLRWSTGACPGDPDSVSIYSGAAVSISVAPTVTTTYFASWSNPICGETDCASVTVTVVDPPANDDCAQALPVTAAIAPAWTITNFTTRCATTDGPSHPECAYGGDPVVGQDVWFRWQAPADGSLRVSTCAPAVSAFDTRIAVYRGLACPIDGTTLLSCHDDSGVGCAPGTTSNVRVEAGQDYLIRVGGRGSASGIGQLLLSLTLPVACPPPGPTQPQTYALCGLATNVAWNWRIRAVGGGFATIQGTAGPVPDGGSAFALANAFRASIEAEVALLSGGCAGALTASTLLIPLTNCGGSPGGSGSGATLTVSCTVPIELEVWDITLGVPGWCLIDTNALTPICHFNPVAEQVPLPGDDCNQNGSDDLIDIGTGVSSDLDGNLVPDECAIPVGTRYCFGDGSGVGCPCGNNAPLGVEGGCVNSLGLSGRLSAFGVASLQADSLALAAEGMPNSSALYFQGAQQSGVVFGDGLRCASGNVLRLGTVLNSGNASVYPSAGAPPVSVRGQVTTPGSVRTYQVWYRNAAAFCSGSTFNLTNGVSLTWGA